MQPGLFYQQKEGDVTVCLGRTFYFVFIRWLEHTAIKEDFRGTSYLFLDPILLHPLKYQEKDAK